MLGRNSSSHDELDQHEAADQKHEEDDRRQLEIRLQQLLDAGTEKKDAESNRIEPQRTSQERRQDQRRELHVFVEDSRGNREDFEWNRCEGRCKDRQKGILAVQTADVVDILFCHSRYVVVEKILK